ncbi:hypothetical protein KXD93_05280 [Mucilaginibacter sp. BJC16-A38]|uniref:hypothetical protein n=1 Tax=Mucilaginibacter phenanthrenivorans TaxID=1234842 RepID=UPI0021575D87|nr:hypothetical protein [Mucilaginibacter phenanthrenivorans]MCR8557040.1 hypothetical protein [Mucilaginibacter phenanthrenivorans]
METLRIDVPDTKLTLVTQLLKELGVTVHKENTTDISARKKRLANISVWTDEDLKVFEETKKGFENWKPEEW